MRVGVARDVTKMGGRREDESSDKEREIKKKKWKKCFRYREEVGK